jgi:serine/threonine-protein kinase
MITDAIGRVLAGRYRIESPLGTGASAHVFAAWDVSLKRRVAVKVLHPALAGDAAFLRRLRTEAQAAASLSNPHLLAIYDWGEDAGGPFLVLEYLGGGSLRDMLDEGRRLTVPQAALVGAQAAEGLAFAHARGFVHRDVKPANLLFGEDGRLRVADFGVARALAEAAWTEPAGATVGTARYAAPEQAQGRPVDGRADVYSLALVLYEAVTGVVPFAADTTIATLMGRIGASLPGHDALGPLTALLDEAAAPDAEQRLDAATFATRLRDLSAMLDPPQRLPLVGPGGRGLHHLAPGPADLTEHGATAGSRAGAGAGAAAAAGAGVAARTAADAADTADVLAVASAVGVAPAVRRHRRAAAVVHRLRHPGWRAAVVAAAVLVLLAAAAAAAVETKLFVASHPTPDIAGDTLATASAALAPDHLHVRVVRHRSSTSVPAGSVIRQIPAAGAPLKEGSSVDVVLSSGPPPVGVPSLKGVTGDCSAVSSVLAAAGLKSSCTHQSSMSVPAGTVIDWNPKGEAPLGATVDVVVSSGPPIVAVPSLTGQTCQGATTTLQSVGLVAQCTQVYDVNTPVGQVVSWSPTDHAQQGSTVTVNVSKGPPPVTIPANLIGMRVSDAINELQSMGLVPASDQGPLNGHVFATNPPVGTSVPEGSSVTLYSR